MFLVEFLNGPEDGRIVRCQAAEFILGPGQDAHVRVGYDPRLKTNYVVAIEGEDVRVHEEGRATPVQCFRLGERWCAGGLWVVVRRESKEQPVGET